VEVARAFIIKGDVLLNELAQLVNGLLSVAYPHLRQQLTKARWVFIPVTAQGTLFQIPHLTDVSVQDSRAARAQLSTECDGNLLGFPMLTIGRRVAFRVGEMHLTIGRRERTIVLRPGARANFELVHARDTPHMQDYLEQLPLAVAYSVAQATEEEARRLLPAQSDPEGDKQS